MATDAVDAEQAATSVPGLKKGPRVPAKDDDWISGTKGEGEGEGTHPAENAQGQGAPSSGNAHGQGAPSSGNAHGQGAPPAENAEAAAGVGDSQPGEPEGRGAKPGGGVDVGVGRFGRTGRAVAWPGVG